VNPGTKPVSLGADADRVVEVPRVVRVDRGGEQRAEIDAARLAGLRVTRERVGLGRDGGLELRDRAHPGVVEQAFEHRLDRAGRPEHALDPCTAAPGRDDDELTRSNVPRTLAVEDDRGARIEVRLPDEQLAAPRDLADEWLGQDAYAESRSRRTRSAFASASSTGVQGSSIALTFGLIPRPPIDCPAGVR